MRVNQKIMALIYSDAEKLLLLKLNPKTMKSRGWYVVTGSVEKDESFEDAVRREVDEETKLEIIKIKPVNCSFEYEWPSGSGKKYIEKVFLVKVRHSDVKITRWEHLEYKWVSKKDFINGIEWWGSKNNLKKFLKDI